MVAAIVKVLASLFPVLAICPYSVWHALGLLHEFNSDADMRGGRRGRKAPSLHVEIFRRPAGTWRISSRTSAGVLVMTRGIVNAEVVAETRPGTLPSGCRDLFKSEVLTRRSPSPALCFALVSFPTPVEQTFCGVSCSLTGDEHTHGGDAHNRRRNPAEDNNRPTGGKSTHYRFLGYEEDNHGH